MLHLSRSYRFRGGSLAHLLLLSLAVATLPSVSFAGGGVGHEGLPCSQCHGSRSSFSRPSATACESCHSVQSAASDRVLQAFHAGGGDCTRCHLFHDPETIRAGERRFRVEAREECAACHVQGKSLTKISEGHRAAREIFHSDRAEFDFESASDACLACHSKTANEWVTSSGLSIGSFTAPRFHEEASHPYGVEVPLGEGTVQTGIRPELDPRIRLFNSRIECATCHDLTEESDDQLVRFESKYDLCVGCHWGGGMAGAAASFAEGPSIR